MCVWWQGPGEVRRTFTGLYREKLNMVLEG